MDSARPTDSAGSSNTRPHPHLRVERDGPVLTVTLDNPARRNAQRPSLWAALEQVALTVPDEVRVVVLRGAGESFSAGLDRALFTLDGLPDEPNALAQSAAGEHDAVTELIARFQRGFTVWRDIPAVVVAAVHGHAIGAGFQLALAADLRIVADDVSFVMAETQLGLVPDLGGTGPLVALVGYPRALEICLTGRAVGAREAVQLGLAVLAVPGNELDAATADLVAAVLQAPDSAVRQLKPLLAGAGSRSPQQQLAAERLAQTPLLAGLVGASEAPGRG